MDEPVDTAGLQRGYDQPEASDPGGVRVDVHTGELLEDPVDEDLHIGAGFQHLPAPQQPVERTEQEVPRAAGRVDQPHRCEPELLDCWVEGAVENELLDELRRLQQRVVLARLLGQVLVEVTEEPGA